MTNSNENSDRYVKELGCAPVRCGRDGTVTRKLGHKVRLTGGPAEVASTSLYLEDEKRALLSALPLERSARSDTYFRC